MWTRLVLTRTGATAVCIILYWMQSFSGRMISIPSIAVSAAHRESRALLSEHVHFRFCDNELSQAVSVSLHAQ